MPRTQAAQADAQRPTTATSPEKTAFTAARSRVRMTLSRLLGAA
jgi:hypothetical protein